MLNCKEASRLVSESLDRSLDLRERLALKMHLMMCSGCTQFSRQMAHLRAITRSYAAGRFGEADLPADRDESGQTR
jgi:predicted anti-sigma-YlaC factor YlaD